MGSMNKLLNTSLKRFTIYAGIVLAGSIPVYYLAISGLWQYELDEHHIILTAEAGREDTFIILGAITLLTVFFFALILGGFVWLNRRISTQLWQPFYQTLEQVKAFDLNSNATVEFQSGSIIEFEELNNSINKLLASNIATFRQQKEFTENASHELQTPLSIVQSKLDLLLQDGDLSASQSQIIEQTNYALSRVSRINKNLLLLSKIENNQFMEQQQISVAESITEIMDLLADLLEGRIIKSVFNSECIVEGNRMLVEIMLTNLLMNSLRHTNKGVTIFISLTDAKLVIANPGTYQLDSLRLFKRFTAASDQTLGSGLGLSIVKEICRRYGWEVTYNFIDNHHEFTVNFHSSFE
jgi:signal transduction histidine kinase